LCAACENMRRMHVKFFTMFNVGLIDLILLVYNDGLIIACGKSYITCEIFKIIDITFIDHEYPGDNIAT